MWTQKDLENLCRKCLVLVSLLDPGACLQEAPGLSCHGDQGGEKAPPSLQGGMWGARRRSHSGWCSHLILTTCCRSYGQLAWWGLGASPAPA